MLTHLKVRDFALVEELELELGPGLCLLTGETGAGKSILVEALGLLAGDRADTEMVRSGSEGAVVEGTFEPDRNREAARALLASWGTQGPEEMVVRRKVQRGGRSASTVNGAGVSQAQLREFGALLVQIHGQHQGQALLDEQNHLRMLDAHPEVAPAAVSTANAHAALASSLSRLKALRRGESERAQRLDEIRFQIREIDKAAPKAGEDEGLAVELRRLQNAEKIASAASAVHELLGAEERSAARQIAAAARKLEELSGVDPSWEPFLRDLEATASVLASIASEAERTASTVAFDPQALERALERQAELDRIKRKYGPSLDEVLALRDSLQREFSDLTDASLSPEQAQAQAEQAFQDFRAAALGLTQARRRAGDALGRAVEKELKPLALEKARFAVDLVPRRARTPEEAVPWGEEDVRFLFTANPGEPLKPLARTASGGELSRALLAILTASAADFGPGTLVFDEVDSGIGGRPAEAVGRRLKRLGQRHQVLCVTHLPQIAAFADQHILIEKTVRRGRTLIAARNLDTAARQAELARMLAGESVGKTALEHARELLRLASAPEPG
jgi:DNA repair protein RecN (Recombination protein N)